MTMTTTSSNAITCRPYLFGQEWVTVLESNDPVYRFLRAAVDLFLAGRIGADELIEHDTRWSQGGRDTLCPAARQISGRIFLAVYEPGCACDPLRDPKYTDPDCEHPWPTDDDRRRRLRKLLGLDG